jgi:hypothetical protein
MTNLLRRAEGTSDEDSDVIIGYMLTTEPYLYITSFTEPCNFKVAKSSILSGYLYDGTHPTVVSRLATILMIHPLISSQF